MGFTKETAAKAGKSSSRGVGVKAKQWDLLGAALMDRHTERVHKILDEAEDPAFIAGYMELLKYFKPKLAATTIKADVSTTAINVITEGDAKDALENE